MRHKARLFVFTALMALPSAVTAQEAAAPRPKPAQLPKDSMEIGRRYSQWLINGVADSLLAHFDSAGKTRAAEARAAIDRTTIQIAAQAGTESKVLEEKYITRGGRRQYWRTSEFSNMTEPLLIRFVISEKGEIMGSGVGPKSQAPPIDP
jgi:hypothetical protein